MRVTIVCIGAGDGTEKAVLLKLGPVPTDAVAVLGPRNKLALCEDDCLLPRCGPLEPEIDK